MCSFLIVGEKVIVSQYDITSFCWVLVKAHIKSESETDRSNASFRFPGSNQNYNSCVSDVSDIYRIVNKKKKKKKNLTVFLFF